MSGTTTTTDHLALFDGIRAPVLAAVQRITRRDGFATVPTVLGDLGAAHSRDDIARTLGMLHRVGRVARTVVHRDQPDRYRPTPAGRPQGGVDFPVRLTPATDAATDRRTEPLPISTPRKGPPDDRHHPHPRRRHFCRGPRSVAHWRTARSRRRCTTHSAGCRRRTPDGRGVSIGGVPDLNREVAS
jgi:hypothetical protein